MAWIRKTMMYFKKMVLLTVVFFILICNSDHLALEYLTDKSANSRVLLINGMSNEILSTLHNYLEAIRVVICALSVEGHYELGQLLFIVDQMWHELLVLLTQISFIFQSSFCVDELHRFKLLEL